MESQKLLKKSLKNSDTNLCRSGKRTAFSPKWYMDTHWCHDIVTPEIYDVSPEANFGD